MVSNAFLGKAHAIFKLKSLIGKLINNHTGTAKSAAGLCNVCLSLLLGESLYPNFRSVRNVRIFELI